MKYTLVTFVCIAGLFQAGCPATASGHAEKSISNTSLAFGFSKAQCVQHILAYRGAISHLENRLKKSPEAITYISSTGKKVIVENRFRKQIQYNQNVLTAGLSAKLNYCRSAAS
ncbi:hypothetical protein [Kordiimonas sp.]|uniref:hypothetical protein n=1 Tax=Kordiimonas sp. TaxID=1970157 RepID=UPI003B52E84B